MGAEGEKRPGLSKDSVTMAASFQNSLGMKNNENHCGEKSNPGRRVPTSGLAKSPCSWLPEGTLVGQSSGDLSFPQLHLLSLSLPRLRMVQTLCGTTTR